jgi:hypothetical protein
MRTSVAAAALAVGGLTLTACGTSSVGAHPAITVTVTHAAPAPHVTITVTETAPPQSFMSQDGVYVVGQAGGGGIEPGLYETSGMNPADTGQYSGTCYYALLSGTDTMNDIIYNDKVTGPATITVSAGVKAVETQGCKPWHKVH